MKIKKLRIENFRGFKSFKIEFNLEVNVLYGMNGCGKTSIIEAVRILCDAAGHYGIPSDKVFFYKKDYNDLSKRILLQAEFLDKDNNKLRFSITKPPFDDVPKSLGQIGDTVTKINQFKSGQHLDDGTRFDGNLNKVKNCIFHIAGFFVGEVIPQVESRPGNNGMLALHVAMPMSSLAAKGIKNEKGFLKWFRDREDMELQHQVRESDLDYRDPVLTRFRNIIHKFDPSITSLYIDRTIDGKPLKIEKNGTLLELDQLSAGEASSLVMLGIVSMGSSMASGDSCLCIFDEIENSLHPKWQTTIINTISDCCPNSQLIVASHSPFVLYELMREYIFFLSVTEDNDIKVERAEFARGASIDEVISESFNVRTRSEKVEKELSELDRLIYSHKKDAAKSLLKSLRDKYGDIALFESYEIRLEGLDLDLY